MKKLCFALLMLVTTGTFAQIKNNVTKSAVRFELKNLGIKTGGTIGGVQAIVDFDPAKLATSKIEATADVTTINTDNSMRDEHLKREDYFYTDVYPKIIMSSVSFKKKGSNFIGRFNLTIKGKTRPVDVPFSYTEAGSTATFKGSFKILRADFGIGGSSMTMSDEVTIFIDAVTTNDTP